MSEDNEETDELRLDWPMTASREVMEKYLHGTPAEVDSDEFGCMPPAFARAWRGNR